MLCVNGQFNIDCNYVGGDKSVSHRALILAAIADGDSVIRNLSLCDVVAATCECLRALGADIRLDGATAAVRPVSVPKSGVTLNCRNSGTTARLLAGLVAGLGVRAKFIGDESLTSRPMERVLDPLRKMGAHFSKTDGCLFESLGGKLQGIEYKAVVNSAQVKSAVLIAGLFADGETTYIENIPTRNHTELMLRGAGADVAVDGLTVTVRKSAVRALNLDVPRDFSSVAFLITLALLCGREARFDGVLLNERRTGFLRVLQRGGANITSENITERFGEPTGDIVVKPSRLKPLYASETDVCDSIDEVPLLCSIAAVTQGRHEFHAVDELRRKESDRVRAIQSIAVKLGATAEVANDSLTIASDGGKVGNPRFCCFNDHRIAMCAVIMALVCGGGSVDCAPFDVSFPGFLQAVGVTPYKLALIGENVRDSRSPVLMSYLASKSNLCCSYVTVSLPRGIPDGELLSVANAFDGVNVTMPFKTRVAALLRADVPSVNTVGKRICPCSTDGYGIICSLTANGIDFANKPLWIVGAGGAAEECVRVLMKYNCAIRVINRTQARADALTEKYGLSKQIDEPYGVLSFVPECEFERNIQLPNSVRFVFVAAYKGQSGLRDKAAQRGIKCVDGLEMLYHQGAKSFALWTGTEVRDDYDGFLKYCRL